MMHPSRNLSQLNVPDEVKLASRLTGAYLCEQRSYFSSTKYILYLRNEENKQSGEKFMAITLQATGRSDDRRVIPLINVKEVRTAAF